MAGQFVRMTLSGAAAALLLAPVAALAQDGKVEIDGTRYVVPAPAGYCAEGKGVDAYMASQRNANVGVIPDMVMTRCDATTVSFDFYAMRVVREGAPTTLAAMLAELRRTLPAAEAMPTLLTPEARDALNKRLGDAVAGLTLDAGIKPVGVDDACGYAAGVVHAAAAGASIDAAIIGCITVVGGRPVYLLRYQPGRDRDKAVAALPGLKAMARAIRQER